MIDPLVSVLVPVYNSAATLERALRSALRQTLSQIEILVADDASTDVSAAIAERLAQEDCRIRVIRLSTNGGKPVAMNRMVQEARGTWVAILDADDAYHETRLERLVAAARLHDVDMVSDNLVYIDAGADCVVETSFHAQLADRILTKSDLIRNSDSYARFDFGILKPIMRRQFLLSNRITYFERTRLAEDFYYLLEFFLAGGRGVLVSDPLYFWTMPFGAISRTWTATGSGAWRYDYRQAVVANEFFIAKLKSSDDIETIAMLRARSHQYRVMIHYLDAQRAASEGAWVRSFVTIATHPSTYGLLARRIWGRLCRQRQTESKTMTSIAHPSLRASAPVQVV